MISRLYLLPHFVGFFVAILEAMIAERILVNKKKMVTNRSSARLDWIDRAKGIAIILVVYGHVILGMYGTQLQALNTDLFVQYLVIYSFHMPLFFFLSGMLAQSWSKKKFMPALASKANTLLRPYLIWGVIQGLSIMVLSTYTQGQMSWLDILALPIKPYSQFWFIYVLFFIFLLFYGLKRLKWAGATPVIVAILFLLSPLLTDIWVLGQITFNLAFFMCGVYFSDFKRLPFTKSAIIFTLLLSLLAFCIINYLLYLSLIPPIWKPLFQFVCAIAGIILTIGLSNIAIPLLSFIGRFTMPIYLLHVFFASGVRIIFTRFGLGDETALILISGTILGVICPIIAYVIFAKVKLARYLF